MVKRKLKTSAEPAAKVSKTDDAETTPSDERKEILIPFGFDEKDCDVIIETKDKEVHIPVNFLKMATNGNSLQSFTDGKMNIDVSSEGLLEALGFYVPKSWKDGAKGCKFSLKYKHRFVFID